MNYSTLAESRHESPLAPPAVPLNRDDRSLVEFDSVSKWYGAVIGVNEISLRLGPGITGLLGANGAGKTTLLKILVGLERPDRGDVHLNPAVRIGYIDQEGVTLDPSKTVLEAAHEDMPYTQQQIITILLRSGLFRYDDLSKRVGELSSGQRRKLQIARLIAERTNLLVLDEPTNYVSFDVLEGLEEALRHFPGPVIAASHWP